MCAQPARFSTAGPIFCRRAIHYVRSSYYPFGALRTTEGSPLTSVTDYTFAGQKLDSSDSLMFYGAGYYDGALGRFIQPDTMVPGAGNPQALNRYTCVLNNPLRYTDPTGNRDSECGNGDECGDITVVGETGDGKEAF